MELKKHLKTNPPPSLSNSNKDQEFSFAEIKKLMSQHLPALKKYLNQQSYRLTISVKNLLTSVRKVEITVTKASSIN